MEKQGKGRHEALQMHFTFQDAIKLLINEKRF